MIPDFAYLDGTLDVVHRRRDPAGRWAEGPGSIRARRLLGGTADVAEVGTADGPLGVSLKVRDPGGTWSMWWVDAATGRMGLPLRGRWRDGRARLVGVEPDGSLCADEVTAPTGASAQWEQSRSRDGGRTWDVDWTMAMTRRPIADPDPPAAGDFAFLARELEVDHRRLARTGPGEEAFTTRHHGATYLDGAVSVDEVGLPDGAAGMTFRVRDATTGTWSIWWVSSTRGRLEPPVHGRLGSDGVGTFVGAEDDLLVRFTWSDTTGERPRWLQELSDDGGRTWLPDWEMAFRPVGAAS